MLHKDLILFRKIPRNDVLMFLYENGNISNVCEIHERLNQPVRTLKLILDDLVSNSLITVERMYEFGSIKGSFLDSKFKRNKIKLTEEGKDWTVCILLGLNQQKYSDSDPKGYLRILKPNISINLTVHLNTPFEEFTSNYDIDRQELFYLLTGKRFKENHSKKIFISYAHDENGVNKIWVKELANNLSQHFLVEYDELLTLKMNPYDYMKHGILSSDYVIIIFDKNYKSKYETKPDSGVKYEFSIIEDSLFRKIGRAKYISVLRDGNKSESIPEIMSETLYCDFRHANQYHEKLTELIEELKN